MANINRVAEVGALLGEPARAAILISLMDGRALTATELAKAAGVTPQTASSHLSRLTTAGLLAVERQGRRRYHRLAAPEIAEMLEGVMRLAEADAPEPKAVFVGPRDAALRRARTCYDHFAGRLGVAIAQSLAAKGAIEFDDGVGLVTPKGQEFLGGLGIDLDGQSKSSGRPICRPCLDWSERRHHVAGRLGRALRDHFFEQGYVRRIAETRAVDITPKGRAALETTFGVRDL